MANNNSFGTDYLSLNVYWALCLLFAASLPVTANIIHYSEDNTPDSAKNAQEVSSILDENLSDKKQKLPLQEVFNNDTDLPAPDKSIRTILVDAWSYQQTSGNKNRAQEQLKEHNESKPHADGTKYVEVSVAEYLQEEMVAGEWEAMKKDLKGFKSGLVQKYETGYFLVTGETRDSYAQSVENGARSGGGYHHAGVSDYGAVGLSGDDVPWIFKIYSQVSTFIKQNTVGIYVLLTFVILVLFLKSLFLFLRKVS